MTNAQTEARAIALEPLNDLARKKDLFIDNAATASQTDFDEVTREAIELNVIAPLILALSERDTALAAKDAELAAVHQQYVDANEARIDAEARLAEANKALEPFANAYGLDGSQRDKDPISGYWADVENEGPNAVTFGHFRAARRAREAQGGEWDGSY